MNITHWLTNNYIELFGAVAGIIYVFLEIRQHIWLWPVGIITSAVYIWVFFVGKLYADMSLQVYYLVISILGWYWWLNRAKAARQINENFKGKDESSNENGYGTLQVTRLKTGTGTVLGLVFLLLFAIIWLILKYLTDSTVPLWDSFLTSLSVVATWMLARKIYEHWYLWIVVNAGSVLLFIIKGLYPTIILYFVYLVMSFIGLKEWEKTIKKQGLKENF